MVFSTASALRGFSNELGFDGLFNSAGDCLAGVWNAPLVWSSLPTMRWDTVALRVSAVGHLDLARAKPIALPLRRGIACLVRALVYQSSC